MRGNWKAEEGEGEGGGRRGEEGGMVIIFYENIKKKLTCVEVSTEHPEQES